mmetsp:Transcript_13948/g.27825  ORF Transcript_13948/g.27825 Transcript_13948/m.27825 type:complete len:308 (+) Transcript_13948:58-981(+)
MAQKKVTLIDGGLSTQLESQGVDLTLFPQTWTAGLLSMEDGCRCLATAHRAFYDAGADIILTSSYQTDTSSPQKLLSRSISLALEQRDVFPNKKVFVSLGPWGAKEADGSEYTGKYGKEVTHETLVDFHTSRLRKLLRDFPLNAARTVDGLAFETVPSALEAQAICEVLSSYSSIPAWITFSSSDGVTTCDGQPLDEVITKVCTTFQGHVGPRYVGLNCVHPSVVTPFLDAVLPLSGFAGVVLYPNNGGKWNAETRVWEDVDGDSVGFTVAAVEWARRINERGLEAFIGGCCSTDSATIKKLKTSLF